MLIIVNINVNNIDLDSVIQGLYLINNLQESLINLLLVIRALIDARYLSKVKEMVSR